jgi:hypothetical protein
MFTGLAASKAGTAREIIACNIIRILAQRERAAMSAGDRGPGAERGWHPRRQNLLREFDMWPPHCSRYPAGRRNTREFMRHGEGCRPDGRVLIGKRVFQQPASVLSLMFAYKSGTRNRGSGQRIWSRRKVSGSGCDDTDSVSNSRVLRWTPRRICFSVN